MWALKHIDHCRDVQFVFEPILTMALQPGGQVAFITEIQQGLGQRAQSVTIEPANPAALGFRDLPDRTSKLAQDQRQLTRFPAFFPSLLGNG